MKVAADTNVLVYAEGGDDAARRDTALEILAAVSDDLLIPAQVLGELFNVLVRKAGLPRSEARDRVAVWRQSYAIGASTDEALAMAAELAVRNKLGIWDAVIMAVAALGGCRVLLSEDLQHGFTWNGLTVLDPFRAPRHPLLAAATGSP